MPRPPRPLGLPALAVCAFYVALALASHATANPDDPTPAAPPPAWPKPETVSIPMRDGAHLAADVWIPPGEGPYPAVLVQTPYGRTHFKPSDAVEGAGGMDYAFVCVDWRGFFGSKDAGGGPLATAKRGKDGYDCVEWVAGQPWCTGKVGTWGPSALGGQQYRTAEERPPHLACCVPIVAGFAWRYETFHPGGVLRKEYAETMDLIGFAGATGLIESHPLNDAAWRLSAAGAHPERIDVPCLLIGGWFDLHPDEMALDFAALRSRGGEHARAEHRLLVGPWTHHFAASYTTDVGELPFKPTVAVAREETRKWFDRWLRDVKGPPGATVTYYALGEDVWRSAASWPPAGTWSATLSLGAGGTLSLDAPPRGPDGADAFAHDPANPVKTLGGANLNPLLTAGPHDQRHGVLDRPDVLSYATEPLERPLRVTGRAVAHLYVRCDGPDADVHVRLCDVFEDGRAMLMADAASRLSLRESFEAPSAVKPGETYAIEVNLPDLALTFAKGHRVLVAISGSNTPRYETQPARAAVRIVREAGRPSRLILPVSTP